MKTMSDLLDRFFMPAFRWLVLAACIAVALNHVAFWWYWEVRLPAWGAMPDQQELLAARLTLCWAAASLALGAALFDLLKQPIKLRRYSAALFLLAIVTGSMPYLIGQILRP
jgi:hypothetical protein